MKMMLEETVEIRFPLRNIMRQRFVNHWLDDNKFVEFNNGEMEKVARDESDNYWTPHKFKANHKSDR